MLKLLPLVLTLAAAPAAAQIPAAGPGTSAPASPATPAQAARGREVAVACRADIKAWCADVQPGGGRFLRCFRRNADKLTPACVATLKSLRGAGAPSAS